LLEHPVIQWFTRKGWAQMLASSPRPEREQALLRVTIAGWVLLCLIVVDSLATRLSSVATHALWFTLGYFAFAVALALRTLCSTDNSRARRLLGIVADNAVTTYFMLVTGEGGVVVFGVYLFLAFGNRLRYGRLYLHISQALALVGFSMVLAVSDFWQQHLSMGMAILVALIVLPTYVAMLAQRIGEAKQRAEEANQAKDRILEYVSHEMGKRLNTIIAEYNESVRQEGQ
jgi:two-component system sensor histidine kinase RpfC